MMNNYKIEVSDNNKEYNQLEYDNTKGEYSNGTLCDKDGYVYDVDINGQKYIKEEFLFENGKYSDGTLCDKDGYVYDVDIFGYKYKLYEEIEIQTCDKTVLTLDIKIDGIDNCPNYYLSNIDKGLICKKKWNELEVYIDRNNSRESRNLSFYIHHNISGETKRKITINQIGDVCAIKPATYSVYDGNKWGEVIDVSNTENEEGWGEINLEDILNKSTDLNAHITLCEYPNKKNDLNKTIEYEKFQIKFNVIGGSSSIFVKNIEQYIITTKTEYIKIYDINTNRLFKINEKGEKYKLTDDNGEVKYYFKDSDGNYYYKEDNTPCNKDGYVYVTYITDEGENKYITYEEYKKYINDYNSNNTTEIKKILDNYFYEGFIENKINENSIDVNNIIPSLGTIISVEESDFIKKTYKRQYILRYFDENGYFETSPERLIFYDEIGEAVILDIIKDNVMMENQITNNYSYLPIKQFEEVNYYEKIEYDRALNTKIEKNNILEITSYGRLFLKGSNCFYRLIVAHKNDYSKTFDLYIDFIDCTEKTNNEVAQVYSLKSIGNNLFNETLETIQFTNKKGVYKLLVKRNFLNGIDIEWEEYNDWIQTKVVNDYIYFTYNNNVYNKQRSNIAIIKVGNNFYKKIQFTQEPYFDYKIDSKFNFYELKYNESPFNIMVNVYGGDKKLIVDNNFPYKYEIVEYYRSVYFNTYMIIIKPSLNNEHKYIESTLILKHYSDNNIVKEINFKQGLNLNTIEYTILCDNLILLNSTTTMYYFDVETYPFDDSTISYENISRWLKVNIKEHRVYLTISPNNGKKRSTILKLTNNEFPFKQRFIKIIQKGTKI